MPRRSSAGTEARSRLDNDLTGNIVLGRKWGKKYDAFVPIRVFVFEDHWITREALTAVLDRDQSIEIVGDADNVDEGLDRAISAQPDVVLMDIRFEREYRGIGATAELKQKLPNVRVVILTELHDEEHLRGAIRAGASAFLLKREVRDPKTLIEAIQAVVRGDAFMTPAMTAKVVHLMRTPELSLNTQITDREIEVLHYLAQGKSNRDIASFLGISERTVANHVSNVLFKLGAKNRTHAVVLARQMGLL